MTVIPSSIEAFGLVAQEAVHCGSPCVVFNNTGLTSIIENEKSGYIADYNSAEDLTRGIIWCLEQMNNKNEIIYNHVKTKFNTDKIIKSYLDFLSS